MDHKTENELRDLDLRELATYIDDCLKVGGFTRDERIALHDVLGDKIVQAARLWDRVDAVNPYHRTAQSSSYGTPNHRSMTYKARKLAGYSYP